MCGDCTGPHKGPTALVSKISLAHKGIKGKHFFGASRNPYQNAPPVGRSLWNVKPQVRNPVCYRALLWPNSGGAQSFRSLGYLQGGIWSNVPTPSREIETNTLHWASCPLPSCLFQRGWASWPPLWRKQVGRESREVKGGRDHSGTKDCTLQPKRINSKPYASFLAQNALKTQSVPQKITPYPSCLGPIHSSFTHNSYKLGSLVHASGHYKQQTSFVSMCPCKR